MGLACVWAVVGGCLGCVFHVFWHVLGIVLLGVGTGLVAFGVHCMLVVFWHVLCTFVCFGIGVACVWAVLGDCLGCVFHGFWHVLGIVLLGVGNGLVAFGGHCMLVVFWHVLCTFVCLAWVWLVFGLCLVIVWVVCFMCFGMCWALF